MILREVGSAEADPTRELSAFGGHTPEAANFVAEIRMSREMDASSRVVPADATV